MKTCAKHAVLALATIIGTSLSAEAEEKSWSFSSPRVIPCEGVGITGSFSTKAQATFDRVADEIRITRLILDVDSAAFEGNPGKASGKILIDGKATTLVEPWYDEIRSGSSNFVRLVLPAITPGSKDAKQRPLLVSAGIKVEVVTSAVIDTGSGVCALGSAQSTLTF